MAGMNDIIRTVYFTSRLCWPRLLDNTALMQKSWVRYGLKKQCCNNEFSKWPREKLGRIWKQPCIPDSSKISQLCRTCVILRLKSWLSPWGAVSQARGETKAINRRKRERCQFKFRKLWSIRPWRSVAAAAFRNIISMNRDVQHRPDATLYKCDRQLSGNRDKNAPMQRGKFLKGSKEVPRDEIFGGLAEEEEDFEPKRRLDCRQSTISSNFYHPISLEMH